MTACAAVPAALAVMGLAVAHRAILCSKSPE